MYLQITTKCNMSCEHCCFACEPGKGEHMSREVFHAAIDTFDCDTIGGGEPTLHPEFEHILLTMISKSGECERPFIVTNGTKTDMALLLHKLTAANVIAAHLSTDQYHDHDMVDQKVYDAFGHSDWDCDNNSNGPMNTGRWAEENGEEPSECACSDKLIQPDGQIRLCGCLDAPIVGNVWEGITSEGAWDYECFREVPEGTDLS